MSRAAAAQRNTIFPSRQRQTRRVRNRMPLCGLSMTLVATKQLARLRDKLKGLTVNISGKPSRKLAAALGYSRSSQWACFSKRHPFSCRESKGASHRCLHQIFQVLRQVAHHVLDLQSRALERQRQEPGVAVGWRLSPYRRCPSPFHSLVSITLSSNRT